MNNPYSKYERGLYNIKWQVFEEAIAARDKWWLCLLQEVNEANDLKDLQERFAHLLRYVADLGIKREVGQ